MTPGRDGQHRGGISATEDLARHRSRILPRAEAFVGSIIQAGKRLNPDLSGHVDVLPLCEFAQSRHSCELLASNLPDGSDSPAGLDAVVECSAITPGGDAIVVVTTVGDQGAGTATPLLVTVDRGVLSVRHPFYWSGIGLVLPDRVVEGATGVTTDTRIRPGAPDNPCDPTPDDQDQ